LFPAKRFLVFRAVCIEADKRPSLTCRASSD
jgi:hypothetical protein